VLGAVPTLVLALGGAHDKTAPPAASSPARGSAKGTSTATPAPSSTPAREGRETTTSKSKPAASATRGEHADHSEHGAPSPGHGAATTKGAPEPVSPPLSSWSGHATVLPVLASVGRVRVEAARDHTVVIEDIQLPAGEWRPGGAEFYVAFGAPGTPLAVDARLVPGPESSGDARPEDAGEALTVETAVRRGPRAVPLLGKAQMAGVVVRATDGQLRRAYGSGADLAILRVRSLLAAITPDPDGARGVVVRLGAPGGLPLTLSRVQLVALEAPGWVTRAEAALCGPDADPWPLALTVLPKGAAPPAGARGAIPPELAVRHASDDLCVRWWSQ
jgi:hypothetical protein